MGSQNLKKGVRGSKINLISRNPTKRDFTAISKKIADWLEQKTREAGAEGIVVGLSGGVDSAVVLGLAKNAVGHESLGIIMPCESEHQDTEHAQLVADSLGVQTETVSLDKIYQDFLEQLPEEDSSLARANIKPRLRMTSLYFFANVRNNLVAGTGNRTELALGYFTKYGDGGADILPIGGLLKSEVRELARELSIPEVVINKPPSAGLWPGQTDESEIGLSYDVIDEIVDALQTGREPQADPDAVKKVRSMIEKAQHKRTLPEIYRNW
ncbi:MAG: NAD+ synthase [Candidatus Brocadiia bacterium]